MDDTADTVQRASPVESAAQDHSDQELARLIAAGRVSAWEEFFDLYCPWAYRFAYRQLAGNRAEAEDLCSEIMMAAARSVGKFDRRRGTLDLWMLGVARHCLARFCRKRRRELPLVPEAWKANPGARPIEGAGDDSLVRELVNRTLAGLPERQASALTGKYVLGHTVEELAQSMGSTPKAVESLLARARAAFRAAFSRLSEGKR